MGPTHTNLILYSVNPLMKLLLQERYFGDRHYVWCAEQWDAATRSRYSFASMVPPSSNPRALYESYREAVEGGDRHFTKFDRIRAGYLDRALTAKKVGALSEAQYDELVVTIQSNDFNLWRPIVYLIPRHLIDPTRLQLVPAAQRAGLGNEFVIRDLKREEFEIMEFRSP